MTDPTQIVTDEAVAANHFGDFGPNVTPRDVIDEGVLKAAFGYGNGYTAETILRSHGLIRKRGKSRRAGPPRLTEKGMRYCRAMLHDVGPSRILALRDAEVRADD